MPTLLNPFWNSQLSPTWVRQVTGLTAPLDYDTTKVVTDTNGNIYVTQRFAANSPSPTSWGWATITKFSPSGQILWSKDINKDIGLGNAFYVDLNRTYCYANSESIILGSLDGSSTPSQFNKIVCLDAVTGTLKWSKAVGINKVNTNYDGVTVTGVSANSSTGHVYIFFIYNNFFGGYASPGILTLDSVGNVTACVNSQIQCVNGYTNFIQDTLTRSDGTVLVYGTVQTSTTFLRGFTYILSANGSAVIAPTKLYGNSESNQASFNAGALLSNGNFAVADKDRGQ